MQLKKKSLHSHNHFLCNETQSMNSCMNYKPILCEQRSLCVCLCVLCVCVLLLSRGPGGDVSAAQAMLPGSSAGFHTRLTSSYEDKAIPPHPRSAEKLPPQLGQQNTQTRAAHTQTHTHLILRLVNF